MEYAYGSPLVLERGDVDALLVALRDLGFRTIGPRVREGAIVYEEIETSSDLPVGWTDVQDGALYRLERRADEALFGYRVGPQAWKRYLFPPRATIFKGRRSDGDMTFEPADPGAVPTAFIGVRPCEAAAIAVQDRVFLGDYPDPGYSARRAMVFTVAVNCTEPGGTCFCASMGTGPRIEAGYDLALTEGMADGRHHFLVEVGSETGRRVMEVVPHAEADRDLIAEAGAMLEAAATRMGRRLDTDGLAELLGANQEHPRWDEVADRCLTCANCTMVCPTCFCSAVDDTTDLTGAAFERIRRWDSCFSLDFSYMSAGGPWRATPRARYRQWMTHKLSSWVDQFGTFGCVGCGRCITWCPVGIDITEEAAAIRTNEEVGVG